MGIANKVGGSVLECILLLPVDPTSRSNAKNASQDLLKPGAFHFTGSPVGI